LTSDHVSLQEHVIEVGVPTALYNSDSRPTNFSFEVREVKLSGLERTQHPVNIDTRTSMHASDHQLEP